MSFYNWETQICTCNATPNYQVISDNENGLLFKNKRDRKIINVDPKVKKKKKKIIIIIIFFFKLFIYIFITIKKLINFRNLNQEIIPQELKYQRKNIFKL